MGVGINGMGRIGPACAARGVGRRARAPTAIRARGNRLDIVHVNEIKGGAAATAHLLEFDSIHGRWHAVVRRRGRARRSRSATSRSASAPRATPGDVAWGDLGCDIVLECTGKFLKPEQLQALLRPRREARDRRGAGQGRPRAQHRRRRQRPPLRPGAPPPADGGVLHDQLPRAGGQGRARGDRHPRTARSPPSTIRPTPTSWSMRRTRICGARARPCCRCSRPRPAARRRSR